MTEKRSLLCERILNGLSRYFAIKKGGDKSPYFSSELCIGTSKGDRLEKGEKE